MKYCTGNLIEFVAQNTSLNHREMKILFYNIIKAYHDLRNKNIVHFDVHPGNILVESLERVVLCDFADSFVFTTTYNDSSFPFVYPPVWFNKCFISPELMIWGKLHKEDFIKYDPFKSDVFSIGLNILYALGIDIKMLNEFGKNSDIYIHDMLKINYDYIAKDSLRSISYNLLREELQEKIDKKIQEVEYEFLRKTLRKMLEVDIVNRSSIEEIYEDAKFYMRIFD